MDDPGWRRGMHLMALCAAVAGLSFVGFSLAHRTVLAFATPFLLIAGVGTVLRIHARACAWREYDRGLRDGLWGGLLLVAGFHGVIYLMAWPWL